MNRPKIALDHKPELDGDAETERDAIAEALGKEPRFRTLESILSAMSSNVRIVEKGE